MQAWDTINSIHCKTIPISFVSDGELQWCVDVSLFFVTSDVEVELARPLVGESVDEPWIGVEVEDDGFVICED